MGLPGRPRLCVHTHTFNVGFPAPKFLYQRLQQPHPHSPHWRAGAALPLASEPWQAVAGAGSPGVTNNYYSLAAQRLRPRDVSSIVNAPNAEARAVGLP